MSVNKTLTELKAQIPERCFQKSLVRSLFYMVRDTALLSSAFFTYDFFSTTWLGLLLYWNIYGFLMWCLFVIGHDCGHGSFSKYPIINAICGHLCHTPILVPFFPWAYSHRKHHQFHNHVKKDKSYPWIDEKALKSSNILKKWYYSSVITPFTGFALYLYLGYTDGSHLFPFSSLYEKSTTKEKIKCVISLSAIIGFVFLLSFIYLSWSKFILGYVGCWVMFIFWLFLVTYMQHHDNNTIVYDDSSWDFVSGALQTIDRKFGWGIDSFHHNITDGHVVHHLFFTQIPHYHLSEATKAITPLLADNYKFKKHSFFLKDFWEIFLNVSFVKWVLRSNYNKDPRPKIEKTSKDLSTSHVSEKPPLSKASADEPGCLCKETFIGSEENNKR